MVVTCVRGRQVSCTFRQKVKKSSQATAVPGVTWCGTIVASLADMQVLEVRFYPRSKTVPNFVVVGKVFCEKHNATVEAIPPRSRSMQPFASEGLLNKVAVFGRFGHPRAYTVALRLLGIRGSRPRRARRRHSRFKTRRVRLMQIEASMNQAPSSARTFNDPSGSPSSLGRRCVRFADRSHGNGFR